MSVENKNSKQILRVAGVKRGKMCVRNSRLAGRSLVLVLLQWLEFYKQITRVVMAANARQVRIAFETQVETVETAL